MATTETPARRVPETVVITLHDPLQTVISVNFLYGAEINPHLGNPCMVVTTYGEAPSGKAEIATTWRAPDEDD